jgi:hypothetical protein
MQWSARSLLEKIAEKMLEKVRTQGILISIPSIFQRSFTLGSLSVTDFHNFLFLETSSSKKSKRPPAICLRIVTVLLDSRSCSGASGNNCNHKGLAIKDWYQLLVFDRQYIIFLQSDFEVLSSRVVQKRGMAQEWISLYCGTRMNQSLLCGTRSVPGDPATVLSVARRWNLRMAHWCPDH